jgi:SSS family solute:Na+ symporter
MVGLGIFSIVVTLGGMKVIGYTDVIQVLVLIMGGLVTCYLALTLVSDHFGYGKNILKGFSIIKEKAPSHFHMIFDKSNPYYKDLPGLSVLIGGMWINNLNYWGCNQYITQRALGASLPTARKGILFAAFLKLLVPLIVVIPGITMFVMHQNGMFQTEMADINGIIKPDQSYPTLMNLLPNGLKGLAFAALTAAIVASLAGKANSISTIFSLDIYRKFFDKNATEKKLVKTGRITIVVAMVLASFVAPALKSLDQAYQFIQEYVGFISPGVLSIFLLGFFWKRTTSAAALTSAILTIPLSTFLKFLPGWTNGAFPDIPFMNRMGLVFLILMALMIIMSLADRRSKNNPQVVEIDTKMFRCSPAFIIGSVVIVGILAALYTIFY